ncbi:hypothetical protein E6C67_24165 [Azospirillum sp. TSA2s]|nr:hypothetical protein E6C67_24165 [Azospirillum sp. TSA2s]
MGGDAILSPLPPGERVRVRGMHFEDLFGCAEPPHPNLLPAFGGPKVRLPRQRKRSLRVSRGEKGLISANAHARRHANAHHRRRLPA